MPAPVVPLPDMIRNYLGNRQSFYETLLTRLPEALLRERMKEAITTLSIDGELDTVVFSLSEGAEDDFLASLKTLDIMKKPACGFALGRTTISIDEALGRAIIIEQIGVILFAHLAEKNRSLQTHFAHEVERRKRALAILLDLHDDLRYHKLNLIPPE